MLLSDENVAALLFHTLLVHLLTAALYWNRVIGGVKMTPANLPGVKHGIVTHPQIFSLSNHFGPDFALLFKLH